MIPDYIRAQHADRCEDARQAYYMLPVEARALTTLEVYTEVYLEGLPPLVWSGGTAA